MRTEYAIRRPVANTYLVRERDRRRWRDLGTVLLFVLPVGISLLAYASVHLRVLELGLEITSLERRVDALHDEESRLRRKEAAATGPRRLEETVARELGLVQPGTGQVLYVEGQL